MRTLQSLRTMAAGWLVRWGTLTCLSASAMVCASVFATDCWVDAPVVCCTQPGARLCQSGANFWYCNDTNNGPLSRPQVQQAGLGENGKRVTKSASGGVCQTQTRSCGATPNTCVNGAILLTPCTGQAADGEACIGDGSGGS